MSFLRRRRRTSRAGPALAVAAAGAAAVLAVAPGDGDRAPRRDVDRGAALFRTAFGPEDGLGPLFNARACSDCHLEPRIGGVGKRGLATVLRVGRLTDAGFDPLVGRGGPVAPSHAVSELGVACDQAAGIPAEANLTSVRNTPSLFGDGLIDAIPDAAIRAGAARGRGDGVSGRPNVAGGRVGRFGWKADVPTLELMVAQALHSELGLTSALLPDGGPGCPGAPAGPEVDEAAVRALTAFVADLPMPEPRDRGARGGATLFRATGCTACHTPALDGVPLYSDLLLHDMGPVLDDRVEQGRATGAEWRTSPLWGIADRRRFLHDGRATSLRAAVLAHGGEAEAAVRRFRALPPAHRRALLAFVRTR